MKNALIDHSKKNLYKALGLVPFQSAIHEASIVIAEKIVNVHDNPEIKEYKVTHAIEDIIRESRTMAGMDSEAPISEHEMMIAFRCSMLHRYMKAASEKKIMLGLDMAIAGLRKFLGKVKIGESASFSLPDLELTAFRQAFQNEPKEQPDDSQSDHTKRSES